MAKDRDLAKYEQAIQLLNQSGYTYLLVDLNEVGDRAQERRREIDDDTCDEIIDRVIDGLLPRLYNDIDEELDSLD
jgi:hypothetical protein